MDIDMGEERDRFDVRELLGVQRVGDPSLPVTDDGPPDLREMRTRVRSGVEAWESFGTVPSVSTAEPEDDDVEMIIGVKKHLASALAMFGGRTVSRVTVIVTSAVHLATLDTPTQVVTFLMAQVSALGIDTITHCVDSLALRPLEVQPQSMFSQPFLKIGEMYMSYRTTPGWTRLMRFVIGAFTCLLLGKSVVKTKDAPGLVEGVIRAALPQIISGKSLLEDAMGSIKAICNALLSGGSLFEALVDKERSTLEEKMGILLGLKEDWINATLPDAYERNARRPRPLRNHPKDQFDYLSALVDLRDAILDKGLRCEKKSTEALTYASWAVRVGSLAGEVNAAIIRNRYKPAAYCVLLYGYSEIGKSVLSEMIGYNLLKLAGYDHEDCDLERMMCNLGAAAKFSSGVKNSHKLIIIDDISAKKHEPGDTPVTEVVRTFAGNVATPLLSAAVEEKGRICPQIEAVVMTTNSWDMQAHATAVCPYSIGRRNRVVIYVHTKREYWKVVDGVPRIDTLRRPDGPIIMAPYLFDIMEVVEDRPTGADGGLTSKFRYRPLVVDGRTMEKVSYTDMMAYVAKDFEEFRHAQHANVASMSSLRTSKLCEHKMFGSFCDRCEAAEILGDTGEHIQPHTRPGPRGVVGPPPVPPPPVVFWTLGDEVRLKSLRMLCDPVGAVQMLDAWQRLLEIPAGDLRWWERFLVTHTDFERWGLLIVAYGMGLISLLQWVVTGFIIINPAFNLLVYAVVWGVSAVAAVGDPRPVVMMSSVVAGAVSTVLAILWAPYLGSLVGTVVVAVVSYMLRAAFLQRVLPILAFFVRAKAAVVARNAQRPRFSAQTKVLTALIGMTGLVISCCVVYRRVSRYEVTKQGGVASASRESDVPPSSAANLPTTTCAPFVPPVRRPSDWSQEPQYIRRPASSEPWSTMRPDDIAKQVAKNTWHIRLFAEGDTVSQHAVAMASGRFITTAHGLYKGSELKHITRYELACGAQRSYGSFHPEYAERVLHDGEPTDLVALYLPSSVPARDLSGLLIDKGKLRARVLVVSPDGSSDEAMVDFRRVRTDALGTFHAYKSTHPKGTFQLGDCGRPVVAPDIKALLSFHNAAIEGGASGYFSCALFTSDWKDALRRLNAKAFVVPAFEPSLQIVHGVSGQTHTLGPLVPNSIIGHQDGAFVPLGTIEGLVRPRLSLTYKETGAESVLAEHGIARGVEPPADYGKYIVEKTNLRNTAERGNIPPWILEEAADQVLAEMRAVLSHVPPGAFGTVSLTDAINGTGGLEPMKRDTAAGFPYGGKKGAMLVEVVEGDSVTYLPTPELEREVAYMYNELASGRRVNAAFRFSQKQEILKPGKMVRIFECAQMAYFLLTRMMFGALYPVLCSYTYVLGMAAGLNVFDTDWAEMQTWMSMAQNLVLGDYIAYDCTRGVPEAWLAARVIILLMRETGRYTEEQLRVAMGLLVEEIYHVSIVRGDVAMFFGKMPSGCYLTIILGNLVNALRIISAFIQLFRRHCDVLPPPIAYPKEGELVLGNGIVLPWSYRDDIKRSIASSSFPFVVSDYLLRVTMGDDFDVRVVAGITWFTQPALQDIFTEWNIRITDPSKNETYMSDYSSMGEYEFLKRGVRFSEELGYVQAPLRFASIWKPYYYCDKALDTRVYIAGLLKVTEMELCMHGKETYSAYAPVLECLVTHFGLQSLLTAPLRTFEEVLEYFRGKAAGWPSESEGDMERVYHVTPHSSSSSSVETDAEDLAGLDWEYSDDELDVAMAHFSDVDAGDERDTMMARLMLAVEWLSPAAWEADEPWDDSVWDETPQQRLEEEVEVAVVVPQSNGARSRALELLTRYRDILEAELEDYAAARLVDEQISELLRANPGLEWYLMENHTTLFAYWYNRSHYS